MSNFSEYMHKGGGSGQKRTFSYRVRRMGRWGGERRRKISNLVVRTYFMDAPHFSSANNLLVGDDTFVLKVYVTKPY